MRPDIVDEQFLTILDEAIGKANASPGGVKLDPRRMIIVWNKAKPDLTLDERVDDARDYYKWCHEQFNLKNFPKESDLFENHQFMVIPDFCLGLRSRDKLEDHPQKANKLVHDIYDLLKQKLEDYRQNGELGGRIQMGQISHEEVLNRTSPEA